MEKSIMWNKFLFVTLLVSVFAYSDDVMTESQFTRVTSVSAYVSANLSTNGNIPIYLVSPVTNSITQTYYKRGLAAVIKITVSNWVTASGIGYPSILSTTWSTNYYPGLFINNLALNTDGCVSIEWAAGMTASKFTFMVKMLPTMYVNSGVSLVNGTQAQSTDWDEWGIYFFPTANDITVATTSLGTPKTRILNFVILIFYTGL